MSMACEGSAAGADPKTLSASASCRAKRAARMPHWECPAIEAWGCAEASELSALARELPACLGKAWANIA